MTWGSVLAGAALGVALLLSGTPPTPYARCIQAANTPGPSGFAVEVCEPLMEER